MYPPALKHEVCIPKTFDVHRGQPQTPTIPNPTLFLSPKSAFIPNLYQCPTARYTKRTHYPPYLDILEIYEMGDASLFPADITFIAPLSFVVAQFIARLQTSSFLKLTLMVRFPNRTDRLESR